MLATITNSRVELFSHFRQPHSSYLESRSKSQVKQPLQLLNRIVRIRDSVSNRPRVFKDLVVIATRTGLVTKEVDCLVRDAARLLGILLQMAQAVGLVPAVGEDVEGDLAANGKAMSSLLVLNSLE